MVWLSGVDRTDVESVGAILVATLENNTGNLDRRLIIGLKRPVDQLTLLKRLQCVKIRIRLLREISKSG